MNRMMKGYSVILQDSGHDIYILSQLVPTLTRMPIPREMYHEGNTAHLVPGVKEILARQTVFSQHMAMICRKYDKGVLKGVLSFELVQQKTKPSIHHSQGGGVAFT
jgi:hypothetical protein